MSAFSSLETSLKELFVDKSPALPPKVKDFIVQFLPYVILVVGLLTLVTLWDLWSWTSAADGYSASVYETAQRYGIDTTKPSELSLSAWLGLATLLAEVVLYFAAFNPLKTLRKNGWDMLFYAGLISLAYNVFLLFVNSDVRSFIGSVIGSTLGFYLLFQLRERYLPHTKVKKTAPHHS